MSPMGYQHLTVTNASLYAKNYKQVSFAVSCTVHAVPQSTLDSLSIALAVSKKNSTKYFIPKMSSKELHFCSAKVHMEKIIKP